MAKHIVCSAAVAGVLVLLIVPAHARAAPDKSIIVFTGGFKDHLEPVKGGRIDWTNGYVLAEGVGRARGTSEQQRALARRAGELLAARNALAMAKGIRIDSTGRVGGVRDGAVRIRGVIRGHKVVEATWQPNTDPPQCKVILRVPIWGIRGIASQFGHAQRARLQHLAVRRIILTHEQAEVSDFVLVLDARGHDLSMCLFPEIVDSTGQVLYDLATLPPTTAVQVPPARYVESNLTFKQLQAMIERDPPIRFMLAGYTPGQAKAAQPAGKGASTRPASQPVKPAKRRARRRMAVRVAKTAGQQKTQLVLTTQDAERLRKSPEAAAALKKAQVLIVVDAAAAGTEGRSPVPFSKGLAAARTH